MDKFDMKKRDDNPMDYDASASMSSRWQFARASAVNSSLGMVPVDVQVPVCRGDLVVTSCPSVSMAEAFVPNPWGHPSISQSLGLCDINLPNASASSAIEMTSNCPPLKSSNDGILDMAWNPSSSMLKGGIFLPAAPGMLPQSLTHIPADSAFIECAARFSCFNGGNFNDLVIPFRIPESICPYSRGAMQGQLDIISSGGLNSESHEQAQKGVINVAEASNDASSPINFMATKGSPLQNERRSEGLETSLDEAKQFAGGSGNESDEAEFIGDPDEPTLMEGNGGDSSAKSLGSKKRKRSGQDPNLNQGKGIQQLGEAAKDNPEIQQKEIQLKTDQNPTSAADKTAAKQGKQGSQASDLPKEEYIHVRARRGQATNSHSLAERVRREKISERMKFLQDLVPGCSKVTGKAVMLDEIINYVQSLQRQVEFLSMKLATVNPRLDFNLEGLLPKYILQSRAVPTTTLPFSPDMSIPYPPLHPSQPGLIPAGFPGMESQADVLRRTVNTQLTPLAGEFREHPQLLNAWDNDLHNVVQMSYGTNAPQDGQEANLSTPTEHMKVEP